MQNLEECQQQPQEAGTENLRRNDDKLHSIAEEKDSSSDFKQSLKDSRGGKGASLIKGSVNTPTIPLTKETYNDIMEIQTEYVSHPELMAEVFKSQSQARENTVAVFTEPADKTRESPFRQRENLNVLGQSLFSSQLAGGKFRATDKNFNKMSVIYPN